MQLRIMSGYPQDNLSYNTFINAKGILVYRISLEYYEILSVINLGSEILLSTYEIS